MARGVRREGLEGRMADLKGTPNQALLGATIGFFSGFAAVALFGPTAGRFQDVLKLDPVLIGFLIAMPSLSGSLLRIPFSAWVDTAGGRKDRVALWALMAELVIWPRGFSHLPCLSR